MFSFSSVYRDYYNSRFGWREQRKENYDLLLSHFKCRHKLNWSHKERQQGRLRGREEGKSHLKEIRWDFAPIVTRQLLKLPVWGRMMEADRRRERNDSSWKTQPSHATYTQGWTLNDREREKEKWLEKRAVTAGCPSWNDFKRCRRYCFTTPEVPPFARTEIGRDETLCPVFTGSEDFTVSRKTWRKNDRGEQSRWEMQAVKWQGNDEDQDRPLSNSNEWSFCDVWVWFFFPSFVTDRQSVLLLETNRERRYTMKEKCESERTSKSKKLKSHESISHISSVLPVISVLSPSRF